MTAAEDTVSDETLALSSAPLMLGQEEFDNIWSQWKKAHNLESTSHYGFFPYTTLTKGKEAVVRRAINLPDTERIFLVYDKTILGGGECTTVIGSFGLYNCEELPKFFYSGQSTNFLSWRKFLQGGLLVREKDRIYLDGNYICNGFTSSKKIFQFFATMRSYLSQTYPFNFVVPNFYVPNEEVELTPGQFQRGYQKLVSCLSSKVKGKSVQLFSDVELKAKLSKVEFGDFKLKGNSILFSKGSNWVALTSSGLLCGKKSTFTFFSWKNLLLSRTILSSKGKIFVDRHFLCFYEVVLLYSIRVFHSLLTIIFRSPTVAPPSYEEVLKFSDQLQTIEFTAEESAQTSQLETGYTLDNIAWVSPLNMGK